MRDVITAADLAALPNPALVEEKSFQDVYQEILQVFAAFAPEYELFLHSDPAVKLIQVMSYREFLLRGRINTVGKSNLLAFAGTTDLDHLAIFYGVMRLEGETDDNLRARVRLRITAFSSAGPEAAYRFYALSADPAVREVAVTSPNPGEVLISVMSVEGTGAADAALQTAVFNTCNADDVRVLTDNLSVQSAGITVQNIQANMWTDRDSLVDGIGAATLNFPLAYNNHRGLGRDITRSWLLSELHVSGIQKVELVGITEDLVMSPTQCAALGTLTLNNMGSDY